MNSYDYNNLNMFMFTIAIQSAYENDKNKALVALLEIICV